MAAAILLACGTAALVIGTWRSYALAREALSPIVHEGERTRTTVESSLPVHQRSRIRRFARRVAVSVGWLAVAMYGLYLVSVGMGLS